MAYCDNCGTGMQGHLCPNCDEELIIMQQYSEQGMTPPPDDSDFTRKAMEQQARHDARQWRESFGRIWNNTFKKQ